MAAARQGLIAASSRSAAVDRWAEWFGVAVWLDINSCSARTINTIGGHRLRNGRPPTAPITSAD